MDELEPRRNRRDDEKADADTSPVVGLAARDQEALQQDVAADGRDDQAKTADRDADARDRVADNRDAIAETLDAASAVSGSIPLHVQRRGRRDRAEAAHDREKAQADRGRARRDRKLSKQGRSRAAGDRGAAWEAVAEIKMLLTDAEDSTEDMLIVGRAQGIIMQARGLPPTQALLELCAQAARDQHSLTEASQGLIQDSG